MAVPIDWKTRRRLSDTNQDKLKGKVSHRTELQIARAYLYDGFKIPIEEASDMQLLSLYGVGLKTLREIRQVFPNV